MSNKVTTRQATVMGSVSAFTNSGLNFLLTNVLPSEVEIRRPIASYSGPTACHSCYTLLSTFHKQLWFQQMRYAALTKENSLFSSVFFLSSTSPTYQIDFLDKVHRHTNAGSKKTGYRMFYCTKNRCGAHLGSS